MTKAVHDFAKDIHLHRRLQELSDYFFSKQELAKAQTYVQIYDTLMNGLEQMYLVLHDTVRTPDEFCELYEKLIGCYGVAAVPASLDQVLVGDIGTFRGRSVRHLIVLGANEGSFPTYSQGNGVFTEDERRSLMGQGLNMAPLRADVMDRDLGNIYLALRSAQMSISITCSGEEPAFLMNRFLNLFGASVEDTAPVALNEGELAAELLHRHILTAGDESLNAHMQELRAKSSYSFGTIQQENVLKLYGEELELSASKIDKFASCRFAYFMRYGLRANVLEEAQFDASQFGTFVHDVLENTAREVKSQGGFHALTEKQVLEIAERCSDAYKASALKDLSSEDKRFDYLFKRNVEEAMGVVSDLWRELQCSEFTPEAFELGFGADKDMEAVTVQGKTGTGRISGFVDRVDLYRQGETAYVRVVDYKTGRKAFDYADLTVGEGLQMLIYLFALQDKGEAYFGTKLEPAGVLYHLARKDIQPVSEKPSPEKIATLLQSADGRKGLLIDNEAVLNAMEKFEKDPQFLPFKRNKDGICKGNLASEEEMKALKKFVFGKLGEITDGMLSGDVTPDPVLRGAGNSACTYCDFADVCKKDLLKHNPRRLRSITNRQFFDEIMERKGEDHGAE